MSVVQTVKRHGLAIIAIPVLVDTMKKGEIAEIESRHTGEEVTKQATAV
jgi:hypothetical protein